MSTRVAESQNETTRRMLAGAKAAVAIAVEQQRKADREAEIKSDEKAVCLDIETPDGYSTN